MGLTRKEIKHDEFLETATEATHWLEDNWKLVVGILGGFLLLLIVVTGWRQWSASQDAEAQSALADAQAAYLAVDDPFAEDPPTLDEALAGFRDVAESAGGRAPGSVARFYEGIVLLRMERAEEAIAPLRAAADGASEPLLRQNALVALARAQASGGDLAAASEILRSIADDEEATFPPEEALAVLAELQADAGDATASRATLQEIVERFAGSPAARRATAELGQ
jgi:predicted negative regulator of RcsB-dependent stress response